MTTPDSRRARRRPGWPGPVTLALAGLLLVVGIWLARQAAAWRPGAARTQLTHAIAVERVRSVARLVTSEATVRDVVVYENTRFGSSKRALLVVTGRVLAGVALDSTGPEGGAAVRIDHERRRIEVELPPATIMGVEVTDVRTYDERAGLLNPFRPADRDSIHQSVRLRLEQAGHEMRLVEQADRHAAELLRTLLAQDGYTVAVRTRIRPVLRPAG
jgi:hypothetical protein